MVIQTVLMRTGSHFYIPHYKSCLPTEVLRNLCFSFLPGITVISIQIANNAYAKFWGQTRCIIGDVQMAVISGYNLGQGAVVCGCFSSIRLLHISLSASYSPPKILHNLCFSFFLVITAVPREIEKNVYAIFLLLLLLFFFGGGGQIILGLCEICKWRIFVCTTT